MRCSRISDFSIYWSMGETFCNFKYCSYCTTGLTGTGATCIFLSPPSVYIYSVTLAPGFAGFLVDTVRWRRTSYRSCLRFNWIFSFSSADNRLHSLLLLLIVSWFFVVTNFLFFGFFCFCFLVGISIICWILVVFIESLSDMRHFN